jgi:branched-subunit amino acid ABC-type transport system permease component
LELALEILPQVLLEGLVLGFMYALIALGYTMVYGVLEFINFAHSEIFVLGAFVGVEVLFWLQDTGQLAVLHPVFVLSLVIAAGMLISGLAAMALERVAYRPLQGGADFRHRRVFFSTGCTAFVRKPLAQHLLPQLSDSGCARSGVAGGNYSCGSGEESDGHRYLAA